MNKWFRFHVTRRTILDLGQVSIVLILLFSLVALLFIVFFPNVKDNIEIGEALAGLGYIEAIACLSINFSSYLGFLNLGLYQLFWLLILGGVIGFISASLLSREIEEKTIDILLVNPVVRKQIIFEKFLGMFPFIFGINIAIAALVIGGGVTFGEEIVIWNVVLTHIISVVYFLAIVAIGIFISVFIHEKLKAGMITLGLIFSMYVIKTMSLFSDDLDFIGEWTLMHYFTPGDILFSGSINYGGLIVFSVVIIEALLFAMLFFEKKDIYVS